MGGGLLNLLMLAALPPLGCLAGAILAELTTVSRRWLSASLHGAAGIAVAVIAIELMPRAREGAPTWAVAVGFALGGLAAILIARGVATWQATKGEKGTKGAWLVYLAVASDLFSDGLMVGIGSAVSSGLGLLLALGQVAGNFPEGFATVANFKDAKLPRRRRLLLAASFLLPALIGAATGYFVLRGQSEMLQHASLAFVAGLLLVPTVDDVIAEAHEAADTPRVDLALVAGFLLLLLLSRYAGGEG